MRCLIDISRVQVESLSSVLDLRAIKECILRLGPGHTVFFMVNANFDLGAELKQVTENKFCGELVYFCSDGASVDTKEILLGAFLVNLKIEHVEVPEICSIIPIETWIAACRLANASLAGSELSLSNRAGDVPSMRQELVIVSPYPPARTGVADYLAQVLPYLQRYYRCVIVADQIVHGAPCETISEQEFLENPHRHKRVLYHIGNSEHHLQGLALLEQVPGVVLMHDFFLSDVMRGRGKGSAAGRSINAVAESHGASGLWGLLEKTSEISCSQFPCSKIIFERADAVLVHSEFVGNLAGRWYGRAACEKIVRVPFPKLVEERRDQVSSKRKYGFADSDFVVSTFGFGTPSKDHETLIEAWEQSELSSREDAFLLFVGEYGNPHYRSRIERFIKRCAVGANVRLVGYADAEAYKDYLSLTDVAVQLRINSRGETSAAVLDCLAHGLPLLANAHGSIREISPHALWLLDEEPSSAQLSVALDCLWSDPALRRRLSDQAISYVREMHDPETSLSAYVAAIESAASTSRFRSEHEALELYGKIRPEACLAEDEAFCRNLLANRRRVGLPQILVDVSELVRDDLKTGIQRVVRSLLLEMLSSPPEGFMIEPIYLDDSLTYRYASQFVLGYLGAEQCVEDKIVVSGAGDVYFGVDLHTRTTLGTRDVLVSWRRSGVRIVNVLYDLLPLQRPHCFPDYVHGEFSEWLNCILDCSDSLLCISRTVAQDLMVYIDKRAASVESYTAPKVGWFHLGSDIEASAPTRGVSDDLALRLEHVSRSNFFLMVSTLEPRKGHALVLAAFDLLWDQGFDGFLVIVGRQGWMVDALIARLRSHPQMNHRLFWLDSVSDEGLETLYKGASALIAASEGEGFGLPIIEAARYGVPVIARDIPVFREVGGSGISYFAATDGEELAEFLLSWMATDHAKRPDPASVHFQSWRESVEQALDVLLETANARWISTP